MKLLPQEIEVWYLIPSIRRELTKILISKGKNQKEVSKILGLTESAVSQYLNGKRADEVNFNKNEIKIIEKYANKILIEKDVQMVLFDLTKELSGSKSICDVHKKYDSNIDKNCNICKR